MTIDHAWVATRKGLFELRRSGDGWTIERTSFLGEPVTAVLPPDPRQPGRPMIAALNLGHFGVKCHASEDHGRTWHEVATPVYPEQPPEVKNQPEWKLVQVWSLAASGHDIWAGTLPGGLFRSRDGGQSWSLNEALWNLPGRSEWFGGGYDVPGIHSIVLEAGGESSGPGVQATGPVGAAAAPDRAGAARILVGISCGGAWSSSDDGASWAPRTRGMKAAYMPPERADEPDVQDPHRIVGCASSPGHLWCQHHAGVWRSTDGGESWQGLADVPLSSFGFAVAVDPNDPERAWFVPATKDERRVPVDGALAVLRTDDGGRSFRVLREGLPQTHCYDLVYRHGLEVGADGRTLMMGSTTGGLWASDDAGERWQTISTTLPPIYAVALGPAAG